MFGGKDCFSFFGGEVVLNVCVGLFCLFGLTVFKVVFGSISFRCFA